MKRAAFGLLCLFVLMPAAAFADINSISPNSFFSFDFEQNTTLTGTNLFGDFYGAPDSENIFLSTHVVIDGPAGTFTEDISGGFREPNTLNDTIFISIPDSTLFVEGRYSVTIIAKDDTGDRSIGPVFYTVVARTIAQPPLISVPENVIGEADSRTGGHVTFNVSGFSFVDPPPAPTITCNHNSGDFFPLGATTVNCTATDSFGSAFGSFEVFVADSQPPVITVPANFSSSTSLVTYSVSAVDAVDGTVPVSCSPASGSLFPNGAITVHCSATDLRENVSFASFVVTVSDPGQPPVLIVPDDFFVEATGPAGATVTYSVTASAGATVSCSPASGSIFGVGTNLVSCSATSPGGTTNETFNIIVIDTVAPVITVPGTLLINATGPSGAVVNYVVSAVDAISGPATVTCDPPSGSTFPIGTTTVQCAAQDASFNPASATFFVVVSEDTTPPVLSLPANITAEATGPNGAVVTYVATANDDHDGIVPVTCTPPSGSTFPIGVTTVQCSAMDSHHNVGFGSFTIRVRDTTPPTIVSITATPNTLWPPNHQMVDVTVRVIATDLVDPAPVSYIESVSSNQPLNGTGDGDTSPDWQITGPLTLQLRSERAGNVVRTYTITVTTRDSSGNTSQGTVTVSVGDGRGRAVH